ncbi:MAG: tetratricopeptide repeat protein [Acidobacteria bacterium]|nr:tetratricopeptide repeat protein [Acidobacteriota bacterium]
MKKVLLFAMILTVPLLGQKLYQQFDYVSVEGKVITRGGDAVVGCLVELRELVSGGVSEHSGDVLSGNNTSVSPGWGRSNVAAVSTGSRNVENLKKVGWARTDSEGHYKMEGIPVPGDYLLIVKGQKGFKKTQMPLRVDKAVGDLFHVQDLILDKYVELDRKTRKRLAKAEKFLKAGKLDDAEKLLNEIKSEHQELPSVYVSLGNIYLKKKDYGNAYQSLAKAFQLGEQNPGLCMTAAKIAFSTHKFNEVLPYLKAILNQKPDDLNALYLGGVCRYNLHRFKEAERFFDRYLKVKKGDSHEVSFLYVYGMTEMALKHNAKAAQYLDLAYRGGLKADANYLKNLAGLYLSVKNKKDAKRILNDLLTKFPQFDGRKESQKVFDSL